MTDSEWTTRRGGSTEPDSVEPGFEADRFRITPGPDGWARIETWLRPYGGLSLGGALSKLGEALDDRERRGETTTEGG